MAGHILLAEDDKALSALMQDFFRAAGVTVTPAYDGEQALVLAQAQPFDLLVLDVMMPHLNGLEVCEAVRQESDVPVIFVTALGQEGDTLAGFRAGADDYITKPFNTNLLISRCNNLVNSRILLQEKFSKQPQAYAQMLATNPIDKDILDRAIAIIEKHLDDTEFNVNVFAREMAMARTNLFTKLKAITGQTPNDFILTIRLKKGALMLRNNPELNITEISDKIGFSSSRYFSKCFKDVYQVSPLAYRKGEDADKEEKNEEDEEG